MTTTSRSRAQSMCRTLYDAKIANIGYTTLMVVKEIHVPSRGMRQTDVPMVKGESREQATN